MYFCKNTPNTMNEWKHEVNIWNYSIIAYIFIKPNQIYKFSFHFQREFSIFTSLALYNRNVFYKTYNPYFFYKTILTEKYCRLVFYVHALHFYIFQNWYLKARHLYNLGQSFRPSVIYYSYRWFRIGILNYITTSLKNCM